jgi:hypothetical protein
MIEQKEKRKKRNAKRRVENLQSNKEHNTLLSSEYQY